MLASWLVFMGLHLLYYYLRTTGIIFQYPHLLGIGFCFPMLQGPFMFVYVLVMINKTGRLKLDYWLHGLPFIIFSLYFIFDFYFLSANEKVAYYEMQSSTPTTVAKLTELLNVFLGPAYVIWSLIKLRKHRKNIGRRTRRRRREETRRRRRRSRNKKRKEEEERRKCRRRGRRKI